MTTFDVIVPTYENPDELRACIEGLSRQTFTSFRVFVCVDGASLSVRQLLEMLDIPIVLHVLSHPNYAHCGRNATRNLALPHLSSPLLAMIDSDVIPAPTWLEEHYHLLSKQECASVGDIRYTNAHENAWARYIQQRGKNKYRHTEVIPYYYLTTGNLALPTRYFVELGGQDAMMRGYGGGDTEFALRLHNAYCLPVVFNAAAVGYSCMNKTLEQALEQLREFGATNLPYIIARHPTEQDVFGIKYLRGNRLRDKLLRLIAHPTVRKVILRWIPNPITSLEHVLVHLAVFSAIAEGWNHHQQKTHDEVEATL